MMWLSCKHIVLLHMYSATILQRMNDTESEKTILSCIEKQALVQVIIREFAKHLTKYDSVASVSSINFTWLNL